jgi:hypothetical protein
MSTGGIVDIVIAATRHPPDAVSQAKINIILTNRIISLFAGWLPGFGILTHVGWKSGKVYRTPINVSSVERLHPRAHVQQPIRMG